MAVGYPPGTTHRRRRRSVVWPLVLITLGFLLLGQNLGLISHEVWSSLWRLWPVVLVLVGLDLLLGDRGLAGVMAVGLVLLGVVGFAVVGSSAPRDTGPTLAAARATRSFSQPMSNLESAEVKVQFGAGALQLGALDPTNAGTLATAEFDAPSGFVPQQEYEERRGRAELEYSLRGQAGARFSMPFLPFATGSRSGNEARIQLSPNVPLSLDLQTGAATTRIDLSKLKVSRLNLGTGASTTEVRLPGAAGQTTARIQAGAATLTVEVPEGVAAQIEVDGGLSTLNVDRDRFPQVLSNRYRSSDYEQAANRVELRIDSGASTVTIR